jgi:hypothetical protein
VTVHGAGTYYDVAQSLIMVEPDDYDDVVSDPGAFSSDAGAGVVPS